MPRPPDDDYYVVERTEHVAQGDIFGDITFHLPFPVEEEWAGQGSNLYRPLGFDGYGMLITYTSGMMLQPPGTRGYKHPFRSLAPILPLSFLQELGMDDAAVSHLRKQDPFNYFMYLPACAGEFEESAVLLFRPVLHHQEQIQGKRVVQLKLPAAIQLQVKLAGTFLGGKADPGSLAPDMTDHWNPPDE